MGRVPEIRPGLRATVDRIEGDMVVLEVAPHEMCDIPRTRFPTNVREGDVVEADEDGHFMVDDSSTKAARTEVEHLVSELVRRDPGGDIAL